MFYIFVGYMSEEYLKIKKAMEKEEEEHLIIIIHEREKMEAKFPHFVFTKKCEFNIFCFYDRIAFVYYYEL